MYQPNATLGKQIVMLTRHVTFWQALDGAIKRPRKNRSFQIRWREVLLACFVQIDLWTLESLTKYLENLCVSLVRLNTLALPWVLGDYINRSVYYCFPVSPSSCLYLPDIWGIYPNTWQCVIISELNINWENIQVFLLYTAFMQTQSIGKSKFRITNLSLKNSAHRSEIV